ncbi:MAG: sugar phosphate isomerase/epimerase [Clostridia bacterium]|nr:sugar phosphate isomerase/epimerase [Clostridia bacterium]
MYSKISFYSSPFPWIKSYYDLIDVAAEYGISSIEGFCFFELSVPDIEAARKIKEYSDSKNILFSCFSIYIDLTGDDSKEKIELAKRYADVAAALGSPFFHHTIAPEFNFTKDKEKHFKRGIDAVREIYDYSAKIGIKAIYENQGFLFNGVDNFARFLREVNREIKVVVDFGNIYQSDDSLEEFIEAFAKYVCNVHLKDVFITEENIYGTGHPRISGGYMNETEIGKGSVDFEKCIKMLKKAGYDGHYAIEYGATENNPTTIKEILDLVDNWINN